MEASGERIRDKNRDRETKTGAEEHGCCPHSRINWRTLLVQDAPRNIKDTEGPRKKQPIDDYGGLTRNALQDCN